MSGLRVVFIGENASRQSEHAPGEVYLARNAPSARWRRGGWRCAGVCACRPCELAGRVAIAREASWVLRGKLVGTGVDRLAVDGIQGAPAAYGRAHSGGRRSGGREIEMRVFS